MNKNSYCCLLLIIVLITSLVFLQNKNESFYQTNLNNYGCDLMNLINEARTDASQRKCKKVIDGLYFMRKYIFGWLDNEYKIKKNFFDLDDSKIYIHTPLNKKTFFTQQQKILMNDLNIIKCLINFNTSYVEFKNMVFSYFNELIKYCDEPGLYSEIPIFTNKNTEYSPDAIPETETNTDYGKTYSSPVSNVGNVGQNTNNKTPNTAMSDSSYVSNVSNMGNEGQSNHGSYRQSMSNNDYVSDVSYMS